MMFDKLCGLVERHFDFLTSLLREAAVFIFEARPHEVLPKNIAPETFEEFFLPFPIIAVEDAGGCILLADDIPLQTGFSNSRFFIEIVRADAPPEFFGDGAPDQAEVQAMARQLNLSDPITIAWGTIRRILNHGGRYSIDGTVHRTALFSHNKLVFAQTGAELPEEFAHHILKNVVVALEEILHLNGPDSFVLETAPLNVKKAKPKKILRSHQRPLYTLLTPNRIRDQMGLPQPAAPSSGRKRKSPRPHDRRRCVNYLSADRHRIDPATGKERPQKVIPSGPRKGELYYTRAYKPAIWIGPKENRVGNKIYRVRLDL